MNSEILEFSEKKISNSSIEFLIAKSELSDPNKKHLVFFDFDETIIEGESFYEMVKLIPDMGTEAVNKLFSQVGNWFRFVEEIMKYLIKYQIHAWKIKEQFKKLRLTESFEDLLNFLFANKDKFEIHIISGTYDIFIKWILEYHGFFHRIDEIHCLKAIIEDDFVKFISPSEFLKCSECHFCICKATTIKNIIQGRQYERWHYIGDGSNDICPAMMLNNKDFLYPRKDYKLYKKIYEENYEEKINSKIICWENGKNILENLKNLFPDVY